MKDTSRFLKIFRTQAVLIIITLAAEFILGMYTSLFVEFPDTLVNGNAWSWSMQASPIILAHMLLGSLMLLVALSMVVFGGIARSQSAVVASVVGLVFMGVAYFSGASFLANVSDDRYSFLMALGFLGSLLAYCAAYYFTRPYSRN